jgi:tetratricopeptide (TPR) repeat protein
LNASPASRIRACVISAHRAGLIEKAALLWGVAGQRSLARSALIEAVEQIARALALLTKLPGTPALRREEIKLQVALANALMHAKGYAAPETKIALDQALVLIEQAKALGEPPEDPLLLFSNLYGFWVANYVAFNGDVTRELAAQFLTLADMQEATAPLVIGHRLMGASLVLTGDVAGSRAHYDQALALYDPTEHRPLATRFGQDIRVAALSYRSLAMYTLGYPEAALADAKRAIRDAREIGHAPALMFALCLASFIHILCGNYATADAQIDEVVALADDKAALFWKVQALLGRGWIYSQTGKAADAVQIITFNLTVLRSAGATVWLPQWLSCLARSYSELGQLDDAWHCISEAMRTAETTKETAWEADVQCIAGEIALLSYDEATAAAYFNGALAVARQQRAKYSELHAAMSLARLWRDQGKVQQAGELLAAVYGWFTEGFDTRDLREAKALLDEL